MELPRNPSQNKIPRYWQARKAARERTAVKKIAPTRWSDADWLVVEAEAEKIRAHSTSPVDRDVIRRKV